MIDNIRINEKGTEKIALRCQVGLANRRVLRHNIGGELDSTGSVSSRESHGR